MKRVKRKLVVRSRVGISNGSTENYRQTRKRASGRLRLNCPTHIHRPDGTRRRKKEIEIDDRDVSLQDEKRKSFFVEHLFLLFF